MVTPTQARKLTQFCRGIREQGLHISREFLQGQVGLSHKQGFEAQHSSEQNEGSTGTVSLRASKGDTLGRKGMEHAKQDAHEVPIRTDTQAKHIEEEGPHSRRRRQPSTFSLPRAGQSLNIDHQGLPCG